MFSRIFGRSRSHEVPQQLYGTVVAQARQPVFFTRYGFADSVTGRFDVLALHLFLFSRRLVREDTDTARSLNQEVFDYFTADTDRALRELGVGDTSVPKRKKKMIRTFYALVEEFGPALDTEDPGAVREQVGRRFDGEDQDDACLNALSGYIMAAAAELDKIPAESIYKGIIAYPNAEAYL